MPHRILRAPIKVHADAAERGTVFDWYYLPLVLNAIPARLVWGVVALTRNWAAPAVTRGLERVCLLLRGVAGKGRYWRFLPFRTNEVPASITKLLKALVDPMANQDQMLEVRRQVEAWLEDPFNPFARRGLPVAL